MAFDFSFEQALHQLGEAALLSISQSLSGFFDFRVQCYVSFFGSSAKSVFSTVKGQEAEG